MRWGGGVKKGQKSSDVIYERPLSTVFTKDLTSKMKSCDTLQALFQIRSENTPEPTY